jgi:hypothetical protein
MWRKKMYGDYEPGREYKLQAMHESSRETYREELRRNKDSTAPYILEKKEERQLCGPTGYPYWK